MTHRAMLEGSSATFLPEHGHVLIAGSTGVGKTVFGSDLLCAKIKDPSTAVIVIDPDGDVSPKCYEFIANPKNHLGWRAVHYLRPASSEAFALPLLCVPDRDPMECHNKALRALSVFAQFFQSDAGEFGVRLSKYFYLGALGLACTGRPLVALPELYNQGARELRAIIADALPHAFLQDAWLAVDGLSARAQIEYRDPLVSRLQPVYGSAVLRRVFGPQPPIDVAAVLRKREVILLDLSGLEHRDAVLVGKALFSIVYHEAMTRDPRRAPRATVFIDESFDYITPDTARGFDRLRKRGVQIILCIQRLAQLAKLGDNDAAATLSAVMSGTRTKVIFRLPEPDDAEYAARLLFAGNVRLNEWKPGTERPVVVGYRREIMRSQSHSKGQAHHEARSEGVSSSTAVAHSRARGTSRTESVSETDASSRSSAAGSNWSDGHSRSMSLSESIGTSQTMAPPPDEEPLFLPSPDPVIWSVGESASVSFGQALGTSHAVGGSFSQTAGSSQARTHARGRGQSESESETHSRSHSCSAALSRGSSVSVSRTAGESESIVPVMEWLPNQTYSLPEQLHRLSGEIQNLALREVFVKFDDAPPVRTRTTTSVAPFANQTFKRLFMPLFHARRVAASPYLIPASDADALIAQQLAGLVPPEVDEDFGAPEPMRSLNVIAGGRRGGDN